MATIEIPSFLSFTKVKTFKLERLGNILRSRFTGQRQKLVYPYAIWYISAELREYDGTQAGAIRSFLVQLEGIGNQFKLPVPGYQKSATGYIANRAATQVSPVRSQSVTVGGGTPNAPYLNDGDYITIRDELKLVVGNVAFDASGNATVNFKPHMRKQINIGNLVYCNNPWVMVEALDDDVANWSISPPTRQKSSIDLVEVIDA